jgi:predicted transcriptional regulator
MIDLKSVRKAAGISQIQLAQRAGVSRFRISLAEADTLQLRPEEIDAIRHAVQPGMEKTARVAADFQSQMKSHAVATT